MPVDRGAVRFFSPQGPAPARHGGDAGDNEEHGRQAEDQHIEHGAFNHGRSGLHLVTLTLLQPDATSPIERTGTITSLQRIAVVCAVTVLAATTLFGTGAGASGSPAPPPLRRRGAPRPAHAPGG